MTIFCAINLFADGDIMLSLLLVLGWLYSGIYFCRVNGPLPLHNPMFLLGRSTIFLQGALFRGMYHPLGLYISFGVVPGFSFGWASKTAWAHPLGPSIHNPPVCFIFGEILFVQHSSAFLAEDLKNDPGAICFCRIAYKNMNVEYMYTCTHFTQFTLSTKKIIIWNLV